jgi:hypothetical protein
MEKIVNEWPVASGQWPDRESTDHWPPATDH